MAPRPRTVVLIHGWPVTTAHWRFLRPALAESGLAPIELTLPGLGAHPDVVAGSADKRALAEAALVVLSQRGVTEFSVVGHDWGATVGAVMAYLAPERVRSLVVEEEILPGVDVDLPAHGSYPTWHGPFNRSVGLAERLVPGREDAYFGAFLDQSAGLAGLDPAVRAAYLVEYTEPGVLDAGLALYRARPDDVRMTAQLVRRPLGCRVLAIGGVHAMGAAVATGMRRVAGEVDELVVPSAGHYPAEQAPDLVIDAVRAFLAAD
jgi:pimeloyl-ACP methyl ester carboxylesterase